MAKTFDNLLSAAEKIRTNVLPESNTAGLVGQTLKDIAGDRCERRLEESEEARGRLYPGELPHQCPDGRFPLCGRLLPECLHQKPDGNETLYCGGKGSQRMARQHIFCCRNRRQVYRAVQTGMRRCERGMLQLRMQLGGQYRRAADNGRSIHRGWRKSELRNRAQHSLPLTRKRRMGTMGILCPERHCQRSHQQ